MTYLHCRIQDVQRQLQEMGFTSFDDYDEWQALYDHLQATDLKTTVCGQAFIDMMEHDLDISKVYKSFTPENARQFTELWANTPLVTIPSQHLEFFTTFYTSVLYITKEVKPND